MPFQLDHIVISVQNLPAATANFRELGFTVLPGGQHSSGTTENAIIAFADGTYIELITPTGNPPSGKGMDFSLLVNPHDGFTGFALLSSDLEAGAASMATHDIPVQPVQQGNRTKPDGTHIAWKMALITGTMSPFLIQDETERALRVSNLPEHITHANGTQGISNLTIVTTDLAPLQARYSAILGSDPQPAASSVTYTLSGTSMTLSPASTLAHQQHIHTYGDAPYQITLRTIHSDTYTKHIHGARLQFTPNNT